MQRQAADLLADRACRRSCAAATIDAEALQQRQRRLERVFARTLEPLERARIAAPRDHVEHGARTDRPGESPARGAAAADRARPTTAARSRAPAGRPGRRADRQRPRVMRSISRLSMPRVGVVARDLVQAGVDDRGDARHRQRRLGDVGRDDDAPPRVTGRSARSCSSASSDPWSGTTSTPRPTCAAARRSRGGSPRRPAESTGRCPSVAPSSIDRRRRRPTAPAR